MVSSAEVWVTSKLVELVQRFGLNPVDAEFDLSYIVHDEDENPDKHDSFYSLHAIGDPTTSVTEADGPKLQKVWDLLGLDGRGYRRFENLSNVAEAVDQALSFAPRLPPTPRTR